jgi:hypothetical protein
MQVPNFIRRKHIVECISNDYFKTRFEESCASTTQKNVQTLQRRAGMRMTPKEKAAIKSFLEFLYASKPIYIPKRLTISSYVLDIEYEKPYIEPLIAQYVFDIYKLLFENEVMSGYKIWAIEQQGDRKLGYSFHNSINEITYLYVKYMRCLMKPISHNITNEMKMRYEAYYGFPPNKNKIK